MFDTIHGVKGETHDATLYLETDRKGASDLSRILHCFGVGKQGNSTLYDYSRKLAYLKPRLQPNRFGRMSLTYEGVFALQHLDKEKGEALVFSGRQFPYITDLVDISEIDHDRYEILEMSKRTKVLEKAFDGDINVTGVSKEEQKMADIRKEIEHKIDELFD